MDSTYKIGDYQCSSEEEYKSILSDYKKIKIIKEKYGCSDPESAKKVLDYLSNNPNVFMSKLGERFIKNLKETVEKSKVKEYRNEIPEKIESSDGKTVAEVIVSSDKTVCKISKTDAENYIVESVEEKISIEDIDNIKEEKFDEICIPLNIPLCKPKNLLYIIIISFFVALFPLFSSLDGKKIYSEVLPEFIPLINCSFVFIFIWTWMLIIGIDEFSRINKIGKEVKRIKAMLKEEEEELDEDKKILDFIIAMIIIVVLVVLMFVFPPIILGIMLIKAFISAVPKVKWLIQNIKYVFYSFIFYLYLGGLVYFIAFKDDMLKNFIEKIAPASTMTLCIVYFVINFIIFSLVLGKRTYKTLRTISAIPIMVFMIILPFAIVGVVAYAMYSEDSSSTVVSNTVGVHEVNGHLRHLSDGRVVYVRPHLRTNPDGILTNNFSYHH